MKKYMLAAAALCGAWLATTSAYADLINKGITYTLTEQDTVSDFTDRFTLTISGINGPTDIEGGRSGVNAIAFNKPTGFTSAAMVTPPSGYVFVPGGLNSSGCSGNGNFFCFDNTSIPPTPSTAFASNSSLSFTFDVTTSTGDFSNYAPDFKIDWVGSNNNYNLVSKTLTPTVVVEQHQQAVPEPSTLMLLGSTLASMGVLWRRHRKA